MSVTELSTSTQNYLKAIWAMQEWQPGPIAPGALANYVGVKPPTVTEAMKKMKEQNLVSSARYGGIELTKTGRKLALEVIRRHRLIETYLVVMLGYTWDEVHAEAENLEHACSDLMIERIAQKLGHPERDPHGDPIPSAKGKINIPNAQPLSLADAGRTVRVERIADSHSELLRVLAAHGIEVGSVLQLAPGSALTDVLIIRCGKQELQLGINSLQNIWVSAV